MARPSRLDSKTKDIIRKRLIEGESISSLASEYKASREVIRRLKYPPIANTETLAREAWAEENVGPLQRVKIKPPRDYAGENNELGRRCIMLEQENILLKMKIAELVMKEG